MTTLTPLADAYGRDGSFLNSNFGKLPLLEVKMDAIGLTRQAFLKFDIPASIKTCKLRIFGVLSDAVVGGIPIEVWVTDDTPWEENTITFNNRPKGVTKLASFTVLGTIGTWYEIDLSPWAAASPGVKTLRLNAIKGGALVKFISNDSGTDRPRMEIEFASTTVSPVPVITPMHTSISAGMAFHAHALKSTLGTGKWVDGLAGKYALAQWNMGDTTFFSKYNGLEGFNVAHIYNEPGTYPVKLALTNTAGDMAETTFNLEVRPRKVPQLKISPSGSDAADGFVNPIKTIPRANAILAQTPALKISGCDVLLEYGASHLIEGKDKGLKIPISNVIVKPYGDPVKGLPTLWRTGTADGGPMITTSGGVEHVMVRGIIFKSTITTDPRPTNRPNAFMPTGKNIALVACEFYNVASVVSTVYHPIGLLIQDCVAPGTNDVANYWCWIETTDVVILGNRMANSTTEHCLRSSEDRTQRVLIAFNDLRNTAVPGDSGDQTKTTINIRLGSFVYVFLNTLREAFAAYGPTDLIWQGLPASRVHDCVSKRNVYLSGAAYKLAPGCYDMISHADSIHIKRQPTGKGYMAGEAFPIALSTFPQQGTTLGPCAIIEPYVTNPNEGGGKLLKLYFDASQPVPKAVLTLRGAYFEALGLKTEAVYTPTRDTSCFNFIGANMYRKPGTIGRFGEDKNDPKTGAVISKSTPCDIVKWNTLPEVKGLEKQVTT